MSDDVTIGIDLGTSNSCVATVRAGKPEVLANRFDERTTASVVSFHEGGSILVGNKAKARVILDPRHTVSSAKRLIGRYYFSEEVRKARAICSYEIVQGDNHSVRIRIRDEEFSLPEISAFVLKEMKTIAETALGHAVSKAVITVPAYFNDNQRQATKDAGRIAGLEVLRILNEPTAAALAYGYGRDLKQRVVVYDFGGGTFDVSVLEIGKDVFEVLSTCGDTFLGGDDVDDRLIDLFADKLQAEAGVDPRGNPVAFEKLKQAAERAKITLSRDDAARVDLPDVMEVDGQAVGLQYEISRREFDKLIQDLIMRTFKVCDEAMQEAGLTNRDVEGLILVGGPTRLPTIRNAVREYFQCEPEVNINPDEVVAVGAAIHAASLSAPEASTYLLDVTPLSLRLGIAGGMTESVLDRNSPVPIEETRTFTTVQDDQEQISVKIYQGESRAVEGNELLGEFEFSGFGKGKRGEVKIDVSFEINTEGIVVVRAVDQASGAEQSTTVSMSSGLSDDEISAIIARGRAADVARGHEIRDDGTSPVPVRDSDIVSDDDLVLDLPSDPVGGDEPDERDELFGAIDGDLSNMTSDASDAPDPGASGRTGGVEPQVVELEESGESLDLDVDDTDAELLLDDD